LNGTLCSITFMRLGGWVVGWLFSIDRYGLNFSCHVLDKVRQKTERETVTEIEVSSDK